MGLNYAKSAFNIMFDVSIDPNTFDAAVEMSSDAAGTGIYYTLDGTEPTESSDRYTGPVVLTDTALVRAGSFLGGAQAGKSTSIQYTRHRAAGKRPRLTHPYSKGYPGAGDFTLTNCLTGSKDYGDGQWQGFLGQDLDAVIDLGDTIPLSRVTATFFHNPGVWIFMPERVDIEVSDDGETFRPAAVLENDTHQQTEGPIIKSFSQPFENLRARYLRVRAVNIGVCPDWHAGAGGAAWLFADEIIVE